MIRGKGSVKEGKVGRKDGQMLPGEDEPLHALVTANTMENVKKAVEQVRLMFLYFVFVDSLHACTHSRSLYLLKLITRVCLQFTRFETSWNKASRRLRIRTTCGRCSWGSWPDSMAHLEKMTTGRAIIQMCALVKMTRSPKTTLLKVTSVSVGFFVPGKTRSRAASPTPHCAPSVVEQDISHLTASTPGDHHCHLYKMLRSRALHMTWKVLTGS